MNVDALVDGLIDGNYDFEFYLMLFNIKQVLTDEKEQMLLFAYFILTIIVYIIYHVFIYSIKV